MKILIDICHPAHVHFFKHAIHQLQQLGHRVVITARSKECTFELLNQLNLPYTPLYTRKKSSIFAMVCEIIQRDYELYKMVKQEKPDIMAGIGGVFIAHVKTLTNTPAVVFYDGDNALSQNLITYPFASVVVSPQCYQGWLPQKRHILYRGYHELAYLHPNYFIPNKTIAIQNGLDNTKDNFLIRLVAWQASHDLGHQGFNLNTLENLIDYLKHKGNVIISSEIPLPDSLQQYHYPGDKTQIHHVMAFCKTFIGESPTMASECAMLGVPSIFTSAIVCGNMLELQNQYGLVKQIATFKTTDIINSIENILSKPPSYWQMAKKNLINNTIDVSQFITDTLLLYPKCLTQYQQEKTTQNA